MKEFNITGVCSKKEFYQKHKNKLNPFTNFIAELEEQKLDFYIAAIEGTCYHPNYVEK